MMSQSEARLPDASGVQVEWRDARKPVATTEFPVFKPPRRGPLARLRELMGRGRSA